MGACFCLNLYGMVLQALNAEVCIVSDSLQFLKMKYMFPAFFTLAILLSD